MKITRVYAYAVELPMKQTFTISGGTVGDVATGAPHVYVRIDTDAGVVGWGEARPSHRWSYETLETVTTTVNSYLAPALVGESPLDLGILAKRMDTDIANGVTVGQPIAKAAVDMALHDVIAKHRGLHLSDLWLSTPQSEIRLSYLISTSSPQEAEAKAKFARDQGFTGIDLKIGRGVALDIDLVDAVRPYTDGLFFRVDANQGYLLPDAVQVARYLETCPVSVFEQPLAAGNLFGHAELRRKVDIPIALDEGIWDAQGLMQAIRMEACDAVVIKVTKMGGLARAKQCGEIARAAGLDLLGGGLTESSLGLVASAHLFNHLGIRSPVDLNGPFFLSDDPIINPPILQVGAVTLPTAHGIGCEVSLSKLEQFHVKG